MALKFLNDGFFDGKVGIGTDSPDAKLEVAGDSITRGICTIQTGAPYIQWKNVAGTRLSYIQHTATNLVVQADVGQVRLQTDANNDILITPGGTGKVGIGTTDPLTNLHIATAGSTNTQAGISNSGTGGARLYMDAANGDFIGSDYMTIGQNNDLSGSIEMEVGAGPLHIVTGSSNRLTVLQTGKVGIGTTDPTTKLDITETTAETNTLKDVLRLNHITSGTAASGLGAGILFSAERPLNGVNLSRGAIYGVSGINEGNDGDLAFHTRTDTGVDSATAGMNEKMRINNIGDVGIGTSTPTSGGTDAKWLTVNGNAASTYSGGISYTINSVSKAFSYFQSDYLIQQCLSGFGQKFIVNGVNQAMIILSNGNVGIGNTNPVGEIMVGSNWDSVQSPNLYIKESTPISSFDPRVVNTSDLGITYATTSTNTTGPDKVGLTLHNNAGVAGQFSPMLIFSSKESGVSPYKTAMAGIYARSPLATGTGGEWNDGELIFATAGINTKGIVQRMVINKEGKVGIGTTNPTMDLQIEGETSMILLKSTTANQNASIQFNTKVGTTQALKWELGTNINNSLDFEVFDKVANVNRFLIEGATGNIGIGSETPGEKLDVAGGNIRLVDASAGLIFTAPNGKLWKQTISNTGVPVYTDVSP